MKIIAIAALVFGLAACDSNKQNLVAPITSPAVGTYTLRVYDGQVLPYTDPHFGVTIISSTATLNGNGTYEAASAYSDGHFGTMHGTYVMTGDSLKFTESDGQIFPGTLSNGQLTVVFSGHTGVFQGF